MRKGKRVHDQIWVLGKFWNVKYVTENLETEKPVKKLLYLLDNEALKKNTDKRKNETDIRIIIIIINSC